MMIEVDHDLFEVVT